MVSNCDGMVSGLSFNEETADWRPDSWPRREGGSTVARGSSAPEDFAAASAAQRPFGGLSRAAVTPDGSSRRVFLGQNCNMLQFIDKHSRRQPIMTSKRPTAATIGIGHGFEGCLCRKRGGLGGG